MRFFIVMEENASYYHVPHRGIHRKNLKSLQGAKEIYEFGADGFAVFRNNATHIVCSNQYNDIIYIRYPEKPHLIIPGHDGIIPYDFKLTEISESLNLFYKTNYDGMILLFHCVLGKSEKPQVITTLSQENNDYFCYFNKVYYTTPQNILCCLDITEHKVTSICNGGVMPCCTKIENKDFLVYKNDNLIYLNNFVVAEDNQASQPVVFTRGSSAYVQWRSGDFIKYRRLENGVWSDTIQCMGTGTTPHIINVISGEESHLCYGYNGRPSIKIS